MKGDAACYRVFQKRVQRRKQGITLQTEKPEGIHGSLSDHAVKADVRRSNQKKRGR
jgi:hypothetical protein